MKLRILHSCANFVAIDKPAGFHTHRPEDTTIKVSRRWSCVDILQDQLGETLYPLHRLDKATSGVLVFGKYKEVAQMAQADIKSHRWQKSYIAIVRGFLNSDQTVISPLDGQASQTTLLPIHQIQLPIPNQKYSSTRVSLVHAIPRSGRFHQIRRHCATINHPIVGDQKHGDRTLNRILAEAGLPKMLFLKALQLTLPSPNPQAPPLRLFSRWGGPWHQAFMHLGACPWLCQK